jgi:tetratricopeptide (TPR) repeat protein
MNATLDLGPTALVARGVSRLRASDPAGAVADLTAALRLDPELADAYHHRAGAYLAAGELRAALADADAAVCRSPGRSGVWLTRANVQYHLGAVAAAWEDYRASYALDPDGHARAVVDTLAVQAARWPRAAVRDCDAHLGANPADFLSLARRGLIRLLCGRGDDAEPDFAVYARLNPGGVPQLMRCVAEVRRRGRVGSPVLLADG